MSAHTITIMIGGKRERLKSKSKVCDGGMNAGVSGAVKHRQICVKY